MPDELPPTTPETVRHLAREFLDLTVPEAQVEPLASTLTGLNAEIRAVFEAARGAGEPDVAPSLEEWPR